MQSKHVSAKRWLCCLALAGLLAAACTPADKSYSRQFVALGTLVTVKIYDAKGQVADKAIAAVEQRLLERGHDWYPWADGELNRINSALAADDPITVSPALHSLLQRAADLETASGGSFNVAIGALTELWGFNAPLTEDWRPPRKADIARLMADKPGSAHLAWRGDQLSSSSRQLLLDPGGIAKGALLRESAEILQENGIHNAVIDLGGDLVVLGSAGERQARIGIRQPGERDAIGWLEAEPGEAVMTSGNYERYFEFEGRRYHHVLDPATGYPAEAVSSVTVVHRDAILADAAATALLVAGPDRFDALCAALGINFALLIDTSGDLRLTPAMQSRVNWLD